MYLILFGVAVALWYWFNTRTFIYWEERGVAFAPTVPFLGSTAKILVQKLSISEFLVKLYRKYSNEQMVGFFFARGKALMLRDPELIKQVLVTDFQYFYPRGLLPNKEAIEPMLKSLFAVDGDTWKLLRQRLTPAFTGGKLKAMFPLIVERTEKLQKIAAAAAEAGQEVDVRELMARYTTDIIGACGFGIDTDSLNDEDSTFRKLGKRIFTKSLRDNIITTMKLVFPDTFKHAHLFAPEIQNNTVALVKRIMKHRNYIPSGRNDFIDLLLELRAKGPMLGESIEHMNPDGTPKVVELVLDDLLMAAQVFIFFAAGFETSSSSSSFTLHQLAFHPEEQKKCQEEVDEVLKRHGGKFSYEAVKEMKYLKMCFRESMRLFPSVGCISRESVTDYTFPGTNVTIDKGIRIYVPVHALHLDEKYFDEPEQFRPERFHPDNVHEINRNVYLPFGFGPRACIGERLGLMQSIAGLAAILSKVSVAPSKSTRRNPIIDPSSVIVQLIKDGLPLSVTARTN